MLCIYNYFLLYLADPQDYVDPFTVVLIFDSNTTSQEVEITIIDDDIVEGLETFIATLSTSDDAVLIFPNNTDPDRGGEENEKGITEVPLSLLISNLSQQLWSLDSSRICTPSMKLMEA